MNTIKIILNVIGLILGLAFIVFGGSDIHLGSGAILLLVSLNTLLK